MTRGAGDMIRRIVTLLLVAGLALCGLAGADDRPLAEKDKPDDGPLRLKRKKRADAPPAEDKKKDGMPEKKGELPLPGKAKDKGEERLQPEDGPADRDEDDKELYDRIARNMRAVEEKLGNREVGEPTRQQQRDILEDIDRLLRRSEQQNQDQDQNQDQQPQQGQAGGEQQQQKQQMSRQQKQGKQQQKQQGRQRRQLRHERGQDKRDQKQPQGKEKGGQQKPDANPEPKPNDKAGAGNGGPTSDRDRNADLYKNIWGHLPESLRAEMNAYSNPPPFHPRYDQAITEYYKTIARQGRKKGD